MLSVTRTLIALVNHPTASQIQSLLERLQAHPTPQAKAAYGEGEVWHTSVDAVIDLADRVLRADALPLDVRAGMYAIRDLTPRQVDFIWLLAKTANTDGKGCPVFRPERAAAEAIRGWDVQHTWRTKQSAHQTACRARLAGEIREEWREVRPIVEDRIAAFVGAISEIASWEDRFDGSFLR